MRKIVVIVIAVALGAAGGIVTHRLAPVTPEPQVVSWADGLAKETLVDNATGEKMPVWIDVGFRNDQVVVWRMRPRKDEKVPLVAEVEEVLEEVVEKAGWFAGWR